MKPRSGIHKYQVTQRKDSRVPRRLRASQKSDGSKHLETPIVFLKQSSSIGLARSLFHWQRSVELLDSVRILIRNFPRLRAIKVSPPAVESPETGIHTML